MLVRGTARRTPSRTRPRVSTTAAEPARDPGLRRVATRLPPVATLPDPTRTAGARRGLFGATRPAVRLPSRPGAVRTTRSPVCAVGRRFGTARRRVVGFTGADRPADVPGDVRRMVRGARRPEAGGAAVVRPGFPRGARVTAAGRRDPPFPLFPPLTRRVGGAARRPDDDGVRRGAARRAAGAREGARCVTRPPPSPPRGDRERCGPADDRSGGPSRSSDDTRAVKSIERVVGRVIVIAHFLQTGA